jgi:hypothetical protein
MAALILHVASSTNLESQLLSSWMPATNFYRGSNPQWEALILYPSSVTSFISRNSFSPKVIAYFLLSHTPFLHPNHKNQQSRRIKSLYNVSVIMEIIMVGCPFVLFPLKVFQGKISPSNADFHRALLFLF